ncbi:MAG TPA: hypothetical protein VLA44_09845 [Clostridia bacterium]|nr:hypothetical protein [Clostridia bacterium]
MSDWVCGRCKSINRERAATCYSCGGMRGAVQLPAGAAGGVGAAPPAQAGSGPVAAAAAAGFGADQPGMLPVAEVTMPESKPVLPAGPGNLVGGFLGGAVGAALATALWYGVVVATNWQIGLVAIAVGFVVGQGVVLGAANRASIMLIPISLGLTLVALVASEYLIATHFLGQAATEFGVPLEVAEAMFPPVERVRASLEGEPITLLFWAIAGYEAFVIPLRAATRSGG